MLHMPEGWGPNVICLREGNLMLHMLMDGVLMLHIPKGEVPLP
jgi:hypothetical protein